MLKCKGCGLEKDPSDFYKSNKSNCKECVKVSVRLNRESKSEQYKEYERSRASLPHRVKARKDYSLTEAGKEAGSRAKLKYIEQNPKKRRVHIITGNAIRDGILIKGLCDVCSTDVNIVAHHCDYDKPLDVMWLCSKHHNDWHALNGEALNPN